MQESGQNFNWNAYNIEAGQTNPTTGYSFSRDDNNIGNWNVLINTGGLLVTDPNYASFPNANWRVDALGFSCTPTMRYSGTGVQGSVVKSRSNIKTNRTMGIKMNNNTFGIHPNPTNGIIAIEMTEKLENGTIEIYNSLGEKVTSRKITLEHNLIDLSSQAPGLYQVVVLNKGGLLYSTKIIKQ